jgi:hypothetical protein
MSSFTIFVSGSYFSPAITMMQNASSPANSGNVVSSYTFTSTVAQIMSPVFFNYFANLLNARQTPSVYGHLISAFVSFGYAISALFYYKAGKCYKKHMLEKELKAKMESAYESA